MKWSESANVLTLRTRIVSKWLCFTVSKISSSSKWGYQRFRSFLLDVYPTGLTSAVVSSTTFLIDSVIVSTVSFFDLSVIIEISSRCVTNKFSSELPILLLVPCSLSNPLFCLECRSQGRAFQSTLPSPCFLPWKGPCVCCVLFETIIRASSLFIKCTRFGSSVMVFIFGFSHVEWFDILKLLIICWLIDWVVNWLFCLSFVPRTRSDTSVVQFAAEREHKLWLFLVTWEQVRV